MASRLANAACSASLAITIVEFSGSGRGYPDGCCERLPRGAGAGTDERYIGVPTMVAYDRLDGRQSSESALMAVYFVVVLFGFIRRVQYFRENKAERY